MINMSDIMNKEMIEKLLYWYSLNKRDLPWRRTNNPYHIWVSEIMLQQTRVETVIPYFKRFINTLPDVESLANVDEDVLLKLWEGLGYYSRVRNMQKCVKELMEKYNGNFPKTYDELIKLPGVGFYTAGAIASIAFKENVPAIDGNALRILSRVNLDERDMSKDQVKKEYFEKLSKNLIHDSGDFNQSLMDLGSSICTFKDVKCSLCPIQKLCKAYQKNKVDQLPIKYRKQSRKIEEKTIILYRYKDMVAILKRPDKGLLASLYEYPSIDKKLTEKQMIKYLEDKKISYLKLIQLEESKHLFSHIEWNMIGYEIYLNKKIKGYLWVSIQDLFMHYSIPTAFIKYTNHLKK